jgi:hypothetical protein
MDMSAAAIAPRQPSISAAERAHPLFPIYQRYRSSMSVQLVEASSFADWLYQREENLKSQAQTARPEYRDFLAWMRANKGGARKCPVGNSFPNNFHFWLEGGRW